MNEKPKRPFWQIHLSTLIINLLVVATLLPANIIERFNRQSESECGFPFVAYRTFVFAPRPAWNPITGTHIATDASVFLRGEWSYVGVLQNVLFTGLLLAVITILSEWFIRRREARQKMNTSPARRPSFRIHLSTVIALTLTTGGLLGLNLRGRYEFFYSQETYCYGWPIPLVHKGVWFRDNDFHFVESKGWIIDSFCWAFILILFTASVEWWARRRKQGAA